MSETELKSGSGIQKQHLDILMFFLSYETTLNVIFLDIDLIPAKLRNFDLNVDSKKSPIMTGLRNPVNLQ